MFAWISIVLAFVSAACVATAGVIEYKNRPVIDPSNPDAVKMQVGKVGEVSWLTVWTLSAAGTAALSAASSAIGQLVGA